MDVVDVTVGHAAEAGVRRVKDDQP